MKQTIFENLCEIVGRDSVLCGEPMKQHTTFRIGGPADYFICPHTADQVRDAVAFCKKRDIPWMILGNGSNMLVSDSGIRGVVLQIDHSFQNVARTEKGLWAQAGILLSRLAAEALKAELSGMEFAAGIPGTLGGAVSMNAGAYGGEMKDILSSVLVLDDQGMLRKIKVQDLQMGYRTSLVREKNWVVLEAELLLNRSNQKAIRTQMEELRKRRVEKQPLELPSAGSMFKRPEGYFAGKLIMDAGLRGYRVGDAQISEKHCGFVVNLGNATAEDVRTLITDVQKKVKETFGVYLEPEVRMVGFEDDPKKAE